MRAAVIGTGIMGAGMARSLAREGHEVRVWNRSADKAQALEGDGIRAAETVAEAVEGADAVVTMLFDADSVLAVADELVGALGPDAVWIQAGTVGPDGIRRIADVAGAARDRVLDAPVLGTRKPAEEGNLVFLVSGSAGARDAAASALEAMGSRVVVAGEEVGQASGLKLAANSWVTLLTAGTAQALAMTEALGVEPRLFLEAIDGGPVDSPYAHIKGGAMIEQAWTPVSFEVDGVRKDIGLMLDAVADSGFPDGMLRAVLDVFARASDRGHGAEDMAAARTAFDS